jgi:hypothetical protein
MKIKRQSKPKVTTTKRKANKCKDKVIADSLDANISDTLSLLKSTKKKMAEKKEKRRKMQESTDDVMDLLGKF